MNTLIPIELYSNVYFFILLLIVSVIYLQSFKTDFEERNFFGITLLLFILFYMGLRPISFVFADMGIYNRLFEKYQEGEPFTSDKDVFFDYFVFLCSKIMNASLFFFLCSCLYVLPLYAASKKIFKEYWFYSFLMIVASMSFWAYGVNGIRNGIATSVFIYAISRDNKILTFALLILSTFIHKSLLLPFIAYISSSYYTNSKVYLKFWFLMIPISFVFGTFFGTFFTSLGLVEESRIEGYFSDAEARDVIIKVGFRWDFLLYSASGVFVGWYFIVKKKFEDVFYSKLYNTYLISNAIWILVITANFSNRFAYLSWFLLGILIVYPFLKMKFFKNQFQILAKIILIYYLLTFILVVVL